MTWRTYIRTVMFFAILLIVPIAGQGMDIVFSTRGAYPEPAGQNPQIYANVGDSLEFWMLAKRSSDNGYVQSVSLSIRAESDDGGAIAFPYASIGGGASNVGPMYAWDYISDGMQEVDGLAVKDFSASADYYRPVGSIEGDWEVLGRFYFSVAHEGTTHFYLQVGDGGIQESGGANTSQFGWGDAPVSNMPGAESGVWDATVIAPVPPLPEPGIIVVSGIVFGLMIGRRRKMNCDFMSV